MRVVSKRVVLVALLLSAAPVVSAQPPTAATYCGDSVPDEQLKKDSPIDLLHPQVVFKSFAGAMERNEWGRIATALADDFRASKSTVPSDKRQRLQHQLDEFAREARTVEGSTDVADLIAKAKGVNQSRFQMDVADRPAGWEFFKAFSADHIVILRTDDAAVAREVCYRVYGAAKILSKYGEAGRDRTTMTLDNYERLWDNYNNAGYSQLPWELYLNGLWTVEKGNLLPPRTQWVLAHPAVAVEMAWPRSPALTRIDIVTVEPVGYLRYTEERQSYFGLSFIVTLSSALDPGYGALVHMGRTAKFGYAYHRKTDALEAKHGAVFSVDLYKMIAGVPQKLKDAKARVEALKTSLTP